MDMMTNMAEMAANPTEMLSKSKMGMDSLVGGLGNKMGIPQRVQKALLPGMGQPLPGMGPPAGGGQSSPFPPAPPMIGQTMGGPLSLANLLAMRRGR